MISDHLRVYELYLEKLFAPEPYLWIPVRGDRGYRPVEFFVDTGAPISVMPDFIAEANRIEWNKLKNRPFSGPFGRTDAYLNKITVKICETIKSIPCLVYEPTDRNRSLTLLGRAGVIDEFCIRFPRGYVEIEPH